MNLQHTSNILQLTQDHFQSSKASLYLQRNKEIPGCCPHSPLPVSRQRRMALVLCMTVRKSMSPLLPLSFRLNILPSYPCLLFDPHSQTIHHACSPSLNVPKSRATHGGKFSKSGQRDGRLGGGSQDFVCLSLRACDERT